MRLAEMVTREDFYKILSDTVTEYYRTVHAKEVTLSYEATDGCEKLIINGLLGFISRFPAPSAVRKALLAEYNIRGSKLKYLAGKAAALLVGTFPQTGKLRNAYLTKGALGKNTYISPQNRSIRFFDQEAMTVDCIIKNGFTSKYFDNQLAFRKKYHYDFMLPLLDSGERWFREPILSGHALARVTNNAQYQKAMEDALSGIQQLATDTLEYVPACEYVPQLLSKIESLVTEVEQRKHTAFGEETRQIAAEAAQIALSQPMEIPTCISHGDFQEGNIWVDKRGKTWIYDWETAGRRSVWYDSAVLRYALRRAYGWQNLWTHPLPEDISFCDPKKTHTQEELAAIKAIILLEDILFYLEDVLELPQDWGVKIYDSFAARMWDLWKAH